MLYTLVPRYWTEALTQQRGSPITRYLFVGPKSRPDNELLDPITKIPRYRGHAFAGNFRRPKVTRNKTGVSNVRNLPKIPSEYNRS